MLVKQLDEEEDGKTFSSNIKNRRVCECMLFSYIRECLRKSLPFEICSIMVRKRSV